MDSNENATPSSKLSGYPGSAPNDFTKVAFITDKLIYDPSYIFKFRGPDMHDIIGKLNELCVAVTDLQQVVTNLVNDEHPETRKVMNNIVWSKVKDCCRTLQIGYGVDSLDSVYDKKGVVEEGIDPYTCHIIVK